MKFIKLTCLLFAVSVYGQTWQATSIPANTGGQRYDDVFFLTDDIGWAANGYYAAVYKTTDGGITWTEQVNQTDLGGNYYFRNIEFLNANIGFLGTLNGKVFSTDNGGDTWSEVTNISPNPAATCGFSAIGSTTIYGCGAYFTPAYIIKSSDSGSTWDYIDMSTYADALVEIKFVTETLGYAAGSNSSGATVLKTTDGGLNWTEIYNSNITGEYVWKLQVLDSNSDVMFGSIESIAPHNGKIIKTTNGGTSWTSHNAPETSIQAVGFIDENTGWMGGHSTGIYQTTDGGQTWTDTNVGSNLNRIFIINSDLAYASGTSIYKFTNEVLSTDNTIGSTSNSLNIQLKNNPVKTNLEFSIHYPSSDNMLIELYDSKGSYIKQLSRESILTNNIRKHYSFQVSNLPSGVYYINFHNNFQRKSLKFVKQ